MTQTETRAIAALHQQAFGPDEGEVIAQLAQDLLARPETISISARRDGQIVGNLMFTPFTFVDHPAMGCYLLSPCGVLPAYQGRGIGREIMEAGTARLRSIGAQAAFVMGIPDFYPRYGYGPTAKQTPYPARQAPTDAWMAQELSPGSLARLSGPTRAVAPFMRADWWDILAYGARDTG